jgi:hypothetical protein
MAQGPGPPPGPSQGPPPGPSRPPVKHPSKNEDPIPDFDIPRDQYRLEVGLDWIDARGKTAVVGMSQQLHDVLRRFDPTRIRPETYPYPHGIISDVLSSYVVHHRQVLTNPFMKGWCIASGVPEFRSLVREDRFLFNELASQIRPHLVLLNIVPQLPPGVLYPYSD